MAKKRIDITIAAKTKIKQTLVSIGQGFRKLATVGAAAAAALAAGLLAAAKRSEQFNKQLGQIATLSTIPIRKVKAEVKSLSTELGIAKDELTQGLYQALSAGVPEDNALAFLEQAAKAGVAGAASTAEAVDILTTTLNAFKIPASQAAQVSDVLFTTVRLGKTTLGELSASLAQVAPIAAASGVEIDQIAAAVATRPNQGTPTAQAMTQIRAAIIAMNEKLGDGWARTMTLQEGMALMAEKAGGSASKLKELTGRVEGSLGILALTGENAAGAAADLQAMADAAGAADAAFAKMADTNPLEKIQQGLDGIALTVGDKVLERLSGQLDKIATELERLERRGDVEEIANELADGMEVAGKAAQIAAKGIGAVYNANEVLFRLLRGENLEEAIGAIHYRKAAKAAREYAAQIREVRKEVQQQIKDQRAADDAFFESRRATAEDHAAVDEMFDPSKGRGKDPQAMWRPLKDLFSKAREAQRDAIEQRKKDIEDAADAEIVAINKVAAANKQALDDEITRLDAAINKRDAKIKLMQKEANRGVNAFIADAKAEKARAKGFAAEEARAARIRKKQDRGIILGKKDQEFIAAFDERALNKIAVNVAEGVQAAEKKQLARLQAKRDALAETQAADIAIIKKNLQNSLNVGGAA